MEISGYAGSILRVDLSSGATEVQKLDLDIIKQYLGGQGINTRLAYGMLKPGVEPLSPENVILIGAGALCGTPAFGASKVSATTRFPLNGAVGTAVGCGFAPMLKWAGYDNVIITGASTQPVYLFIQDNEVRLCDARELWGKDIFAATEALRGRHGNDVSVICIGPAGEKQVRISLALIDRMSHLGRGGLAAVLGAKKLKAIVVRGSRGIRIAHRNMFQKMQQNLVQRAYQDRNREVWIHYGLAGVAETWFQNGLILRNNKREAPDATEMINAYGTRAFDDTLEMHPWAGPSCLTCDKSVLRIKEGKFKDLCTTASVSILPLIMGVALNLSLNEAVACHDLCQRYGLDELDTTYLIELIIELYNEGLVTARDTGIEPRPGFETVSQILTRIAGREGFWSIVADGIPAVLKNVKNADKYVIHGKGMVPGFDARMCLGIEAFGDGLTNPRGSQSHSLVRSPSTAIPGLSEDGIRNVVAAYQLPPRAQQRIFRGKEWNVARLTPYIQDANTGYNWLGLCFRFFMGRLWSPVIAVGMYHAVTGMSVTPEEFMEVGERVWNLQKILNLREGFGRKDDCFPPRWVSEPIRFGDSEVYLQDYTRSRRLNKTDTEKMLDDYYDERGWDLASGNPTEAKLISLKLEDVARDLRKAGLL